jgi:hypothetical protein
MFDTLLKPVKKIVDHAALSVFYNEDRAALSYPFYSAYSVRMNHVARTGGYISHPSRLLKQKRTKPSTILNFTRSDLPCVPFTLQFQADESVASTDTQAWEPGFMPLEINTIPARSPSKVTANYAPLSLHLLG